MVRASFGDLPVTAFTHADYFSKSLADADPDIFKGIQGELGRQQEAASARADKELHELMDRAIHSGAAQEVK